jgi:HEAT repeat protein
MAKRKIEEELEALTALRRGRPSPATSESLSRALRDKVNVIVAKAASVAGDLQLTALVPEMVHAYDRLFKDPVKSDPQCWGKTALAKALKTLRYAEAGPFLRGVGHIQMEPVWGGEADSAAGLRGTCALALVQCTDIPAHQILNSLVDALADGAGPVRQDAVQALAQWGSAEAILLLRLKARLGDRETAVTGNIFDALLRLEEASAVAFVGSFLDSAEEALREEAALALGSSKLEEAVVLLRERWEKRRPIEPVEIWIRAFGASRLRSAFECLLEIIRSGRPNEAEASLSALQSRRVSAATWAEIESAVSSRQDGALRPVFEGAFPRPAEE